MNYTTIEQSKKLLELGLNPESADMHFIKTIRNTDAVYTPELLYDEPLSKIDYPCWSLGALLDIINSNNLVYDISNERNREFEILVYSADYIEQELKFYHNEHTIVDMVIWLLKNGYIKTEKK